MAVARHLRLILHKVPEKESLLLPGHLLQVSTIAALKMTTSNSGGKDSIDVRGTSNMTHEADVASESFRDLLLQYLQPNQRGDQTKPQVLTTSATQPQVDL
jgi:hypothetical protein